MYITYMCQRGKLTTARFENFVCYRYIYDIYFHLSVSVRNTINLSRHEQV